MCLPHSPPSLEYQVRRFVHISYYSYTRRNVFACLLRIISHTFHGILHPQPSERPFTSKSESPSLSANPSNQPSEIPSVSHWPTSQPSINPSISSQPSSIPSESPSISTNPSSQPSEIPSTSVMPTMDMPCMFNASGFNTCVTGGSGYSSYDGFPYCCVKDNGVEFPEYRCQNRVESCKPGEASSNTCLDSNLMLNCTAFEPDQSCCKNTTGSGKSFLIML